MPSWGHRPVRPDYQNNGVNLERFPTAFRDKITPEYNASGDAGEHADGTGGGGTRLIMTTTNGASWPLPA